MVSAKVNYWVDVGLAIAFLANATTGIIKIPRLLPALGISYKELPMFAISRVHDMSGVLMVLLVLVHLILHWKWIVGMTRAVFKKKVGKCKK